MKKNTLKQTVYNLLLEMIKKGEISSDELFTEKRIIETMGYSKSPVREALQELCSDGYLMVIPRCGYRIKPLSAKTMSEITHMRLLLELNNFDKIAPLLSHEEIDAIFQPIEEKHSLLQPGIFEDNRYNEEFHIALAGIGGNLLMIDFTRRLLNMYSVAYAQYYISAPKMHELVKIDVHNEFLREWRKHNIKEAREILKRDIERAFYVMGVDTNS